MQRLFAEIRIQIIINIIIIIIIKNKTGTGTKSPPFYSKWLINLPVVGCIWRMTVILYPDTCTLHHILKSQKKYLPFCVNKFKAKKNYKILRN